MKNFILLVVLLFTLGTQLCSQELFVFTEPASNMPSKTVGLKFTSFFPNTTSFTQRYKPELMFGINKNWMVHVSSTFSNYYSNNTRFEGARAYAKYRFYSSDDVHEHFRMAAFADVAVTRNPIIYDEMNLEGDNGGAQLGVIATKLINKLAVSGTVAYSGFSKGSKRVVGNAPSLNALTYSLSSGYLVLPKEYSSYKQTNLNVYLEVLGMKSLNKDRYILDFAPALQLIFNSNTKINLGYRFQVAGNMYRMANSTWLIGLEHTLFNAWK